MVKSVSSRNFLISNRNYLPSLFRDGKQILSLFRDEKVFGLYFRSQNLEGTYRATFRDGNFRYFRL